DTFLVVDASTGDVLGLAEQERAYSTVHEGAVYLHLGRQYVVRELDLVTRRAVVEPFAGDWYTQAQKETETSIEERLRVERRLGDHLRLLRPRRRLRDRGSRLRPVRGLGRRHGRAPCRLPMRARLSLMRPEPEVRQPERVPRQGRGAHAAASYARDVTRILV